MSEKVIVVNPDKKSKEIIDFLLRSNVKFELINEGYKQSGSIEVNSELCSYGVKIYIYGNINYNDKLRSIISDALTIVSDEIALNIVSRNQDLIEDSERHKELILNCFPEGWRNYKLIRNEYWSKPYQACHSPWYEVATPIGLIKIGWRKRVINIDWSNTLLDEESTNLFLNENVTKGFKNIHAHSYEDAKRYIDVLLGTPLC